MKDDATIITLDEQETTTYERIAKGDTFVMHTLKEPFVSTLVPPEASHKTVVVDKQTRTVRTPFLTIQFDDDGTMASVKDVGTGREFLAQLGNRFELYEDRPLN